jgi:hypothetical protein
MANSNQPKPEEQGNSKKLEIKISEQHLLGAYSNFSVISHNETEFVLDMLRVLPNSNQAHVVSRVVVNPKSAKGLLNALAENIRNYEQKFGEIELTQRGIPKGPLN